MENNISLKRTYATLICLFLTLMFLVGLICGITFFPDILDDGESEIMEIFSTSVSSSILSSAMLDKLPISEIDENSTLSCGDFQLDAEALVEDSFDEILLLSSSSGGTFEVSDNGENSPITPQAEIVVEVTEDLTAEEQNVSLFDNSNPQVVIYCTHSTETYLPYAGVSNTEGTYGGVYMAAEWICEELNNAGIGAIVDYTIHDYPDWNSSYSNSLITAEALLEKYPDVEIIIDLHRDAGVDKEYTTTIIDGESYAKAMLVVGTAEWLDHPNWEENLAFALSIEEMANEMFPDLMRATREQSGRYNQQVSTHSILIEMGCDQNTIEEVENASRAMGQVLIEILETI